MKHDGGGHRGFVRHGEKCSRRHAEGLVKAADRPGRRHGHAQHQHGIQQKRARERHVETERDRHGPDAEADRQPQRKRPEEREQQSARTTNGAETLRKLLGNLRDQAGERGRNGLREPRHRAAEPLGVTSQHEQPDERDTRHQAGRRAGPFHGGERHRVGHPALISGHEHEPGEKDQHRDGIEETLQDDGRERAGRAHALVVPLGPREKIRANDLARAGRQHARRREANRRRPKRVGKRRRPQRFEQELPAPAADRQVHEHRRERQGEPLRFSAGDVGGDPPEVDVMKKQRQEAHDQGQHQHRPQR